MAAIGILEKKNHHLVALRYIYSRKASKIAREAFERHELAPRGGSQVAPC